MMPKIIISVVVFIIGLSAGLYINSHHPLTQEIAQESSKGLESLKEIKLIENKSERSFKDIKKAFDQKDWDTFSKKVDIDMILNTDYKEALDKIRNDNNIDKEKKDFSINFFTAFTPMAISQIKSDFYSYFSTSSEPSNLFVKLFTISPKSIQQEKDMGAFKILPVVYNGKKTGTDITIEYKFIQENNELKLIGINGRDNLNTAMGWDTEYYTENNTSNIPLTNSSQEREPTQKNINHISTTEKENAYKTAYSYAMNQSLSKKQVFEQLLFEGFSQEDSQEALKRLVSIDWRQNALNSALSYQQGQAMSKNAIREQLLYEGFTEEESEYAIQRLR